MRAGLLIIITCLCWTGTTIAAPRPLKEVTTEDGRYSLRLTPGRPTVTRALPCRAFLMYREQDGRREKRWDRMLINDVAPEAAYLHPVGKYLVTLNEFERGGARHALVVYGASGSLLRHYLLTDLLAGEDWKNVTVEGNAVRWLKGSKKRFDVSRDHFVIELAWNRTLRIDLARSQVVSSAAKAKLPVGIDKLLFPAADPIPPVVTEPPVSEKLERISPASPEVVEVAEPNEPLQVAGEEPVAEESVTIILDPRQPPDPDPAKPADYIVWMNKQVAGKGPAAAPLMKAASVQLLDWDGDNALYRAALDGDPKALNDPALLKWLSSNSNAISDFRDAGHQPNPGIRYKHGSEPPMIGMELPQLQNLRQIARTAILHGKVLANQGKHDAAAVVFLDTAAAGAQIGRGATLIESLVGTAVQKMAFEALLQQAAEAPVADYDAEMVADTLADTPLEMRPFHELVRSEEAMLLDTLQYIFEYDADAKSYQANADKVSLLIDVAGSSADTDAAEVAEQITRRGFHSTAGEIREFYKTMGAISQLPFPDAQTYLTEIDRLTTRDDFNPLMKMLLPSFDRYSQISARAESTRNGAELALHLMAYRKEKGNYPESLAVMSDEPFVIDPLTNERFVYRREGEKFMLYSVGLDNEDDGGVHDPQGDEEDYVIWPPQD